MTASPLDSVIGIMLFIIGILLELYAFSTSDGDLGQASFNAGILCFVFGLMALS